MWAAVCYRINYFHTIFEIPKPRMIYKLIPWEGLSSEKGLLGNLYFLPFSIPFYHWREDRQRSARERTRNGTYNLILLLHKIKLSFFRWYRVRVQRHWPATKKVMNPGCDNFQSTAIYIHILYGKGESLDKRETDSVTAAGRLRLRSEHMPKSWPWGFENLLFKWSLISHRLKLPSPSFHTWFLVY